MEKKAMSGLLLSLLMTSILMLGLDIKPTKSVDNWWNADWMYRRQVNIVENNGYSLVGFPLEISFEHNGRIQTDGRDIRVIENSLELPYTITQLNSTWATIMLEVDLASLSTKSICIYYENPLVSVPSYPPVPLTISEGPTGYAVSARAGVRLQRARCIRRLLSHR